MIVPDLEIPWGMAFLPDNSLLITEKEGQLIHFQNGQKTNIENVPTTYVRGQGGLMGIAIHPNYKDNNIIYFTQSSSVGSDESGGNTALYRAVLKDNTLQDVSLSTKRNQTPKKVFILVLELCLIMMVICTLLSGIVEIETLIPKTLREMAEKCIA